MLHHSRKIEKVTERLKTLMKKKLGKMHKSKPSQFFNAIRAKTSASTHNDHMSMPKTCDARRGHFGKIRGVLQKRPVRAWVGMLSPVLAHLKLTRTLHENPGLSLWIDEVMPSPDPEKITVFDRSAIITGSIKRVLMKMSSNSSTGDAGITTIISKRCHPLIIS